MPFKVGHQNRANGYFEIECTGCSEIVETVDNAEELDAEGFQQRIAEMLEHVAQEEQAGPAWNGHVCTG